MGVCALSSAALGAKGVGVLMGADFACKRVQPGLVGGAAWVGPWA